MSQGFPHCALQGRLCGICGSLRVLPLNLTDSCMYCMLQQVWICLEEYYGGSKGYDVSPFACIPFIPHPLSPFITTDAPFHLSPPPSLPVHVP